MFVKHKFFVPAPKKRAQKVNPPDCGLKKFMYNERDLPVELHGSRVVDSEELVDTGHLGYVVGLSFLFFL